MLIAILRNHAATIDKNDRDNNNTN